jgi:hypothetical protein
MAVRVLWRLHNLFHTHTKILSSEAQGGADQQLMRTFLSYGGSRARCTVAARVQIVSCFYISENLIKSSTIRAIYQIDGPAGDRSEYIIQHSIACIDSKLSSNNTWPM